MFDATLIGTQRLAAHVACYDNGRTPDDGMPPDRIVETDVWLEADGTQVTDPVRIAAIRAAQEEQADGNR